MDSMFTVRLRGKFRVLQIALLVVWLPAGVQAAQADAIAQGEKIVTGGSAQGAPRAWAATVRTVRKCRLSQVGGDGLGLSRSSAERLCIRRAKEFHHAAVRPKTHPRGENSGGCLLRPTDGAQRGQTKSRRPGAS